jgi:hypothetical protein
MRCVKWLERGHDLKVSAEGWCAVSDDNAEGEDTNVKTVCGFYVICPGEFKNMRKPTCEDCRHRMTK